MDESFLAALFPREHRILGRRLRPYCYGHFAALLAAQSPFLAAPGSGAEITAADVVAAVRICAHPGWPLMRPRDFRPDLLDRLRKVWLELRAPRLRAAAQAIQDYLDDYSQFPEFWEDETLPGEDGEIDPLERDFGGRTLTAPIALARVCQLVSRARVSLGEAWRMPICLPTWYVATLDEMEGGKVRFARDSDAEYPPPEIELDERQLYAQAVQHLGRERANAWREARKKLRRREAREKKQKGSENARS